jgi:hypothetical protein
MFPSFLQLFIHKFRRLRREKNGRMECWNDGIMGREMKDKNPTFHHSIIPIFQFVSSVPLFCKVFKFYQAYFGGRRLSEIPPNRPEAVKKFRHREMRGLGMPGEGEIPCRQNRRLFLRGPLGIESTEA